MPKVNLTERSINRKPPESGILELWDTVVPGLALRIHYGGRRTYSVMTRIEGQQVRRKIGTTVTHKLAEARDAARDVIRDAGKGIDSASKKAKRETAEREQQEAARADASTFRAVAEAWLADTGKNGAANNRSKKAVEARLKRDVYPVIGALPIGSITKADVRDLVNGIAHKRPIAANRTLAAVRRVFTWAVKNDRLAASPAVGIDPPSDEKSRERVLSDAELARLWPAFNELGYPFGPIFRLLVLTGQRRSEVSGMLWSEIEGDMWSLPGSRTKNGLPHLVPLSSAAKEIIDNLPRVDGSDYVFTSGQARTRDPETGERVVNRPVSGFGRAKDRLDKAVAKAAAKAAHEKLDMTKHALAPWVLHDIRRTVVTRMNETLGIEPHVIEAVVNHATGRAKAGVAGVYNKAEYLPQRRAALEAWGRYVTALVGGKVPSNVEELRRRA